MSEETRKKLRGKRWAYHTEEFKRRLSERMSGPNNPMYGKSSWNLLSTEAKEKIGAKISAAISGKNNGMYGKTGSSHPNWKGGIAYLPYHTGFNNDFRESIRQRDGYRCQMCGISQAECFYPLSVHHINYDKLNTDSRNAISLCHTCHGKTNYNRQHWQRHFEEKIAKIYAAEGGDMRSNAE